MDWIEKSDMQSAMLCSGLFSQPLVPRRPTKQALGPLPISLLQQIIRRSVAANKENIPLPAASPAASPTLPSVLHS